MLKKVDAADECQRSFAGWRALLPHWNLEADRFRRLAQLVREGQPMEPGAFDEAEALIVEIRAAMERADTLMTMTDAGQHALCELMQAAGEFETLLESLQISLEITEFVAGRRVPTVRIAEGLGAAQA